MYQDSSKIYGLKVHLLASTCLFQVASSRGSFWHGPTEAKNCPSDGASASFTGWHPWIKALVAPYRIQTLDQKSNWNENHVEQNMIIHTIPQQNMSIATWLSIGLPAGARYNFVQKHVVHWQACQQEHQTWQAGVSDRVNVAKST